ncbi:hypothetical protein BAUCODRAFT_180712 [Baudoinia panamericana UAMH 10762]|uniref:Transcription factor domain-containing protein n=1 Tax=Baudoinia panamericana (strain UAMH 10762) TaxID=717646 RepID=M2M110_BAUPA|nr:uncharacterized protein BAUCODRAFT_180712 [Baudoinia panamericana UAMH 10762]EMD00718.1 hypothetical protein BAUCODRAFT_180712 [Baudoinia panamericana UAMH 10762]
MSATPSHWPPLDLEEYLNSGETATSLDTARVDSPLDVRREPFLPFDESVQLLAQYENTPSPALTTAASLQDARLTTSLPHVDHNQLDRGRQPTPGTSVALSQRQSRSSRGQSEESRTKVRFVVVDHHEQLKNPETIRRNRRHVMKHWLASNPQDPRARAAGRASKRPQPAEAPPHAAAPSVASAACQQNQRPGPMTVARHGPKTHVAPIGARSAQGRSSRPKVPQTSVQGPSTPLSPLVRGISGGYRNYMYLGTDPKDVPFGQLDPFDTLPEFDDATLDVNKLKHRCSTYFGSRSISQSWVPELLKARHAFLSTICISSAYDDIMRRALYTPDQRPRRESVERALARKEVTKMINQSMNDTQMQVADATIVAVLHLLNAEIMGCDDRVMRVHQAGLCAMVEKRGGLNSLGVNGQLAGITTITMHLIATLREVLPQKVYLDYAKEQRTKPPTHVRPLPECPLYYRHSGYLTIANVLGPGSHIYRLLESVRQLTGRCFELCDENDIAVRWPPQGDHAATAICAEMQVLTERIFAFEAGEGLEFGSMSDRYMYEAIRLTSHIYAQALINRVPFSKAANQLRFRDHYRSLQVGTLSHRAIYVEGCAMHIHVRNALSRTDTSDCWGHLAGVLFWIGLVAGAAANPAAAPEGYIERRVRGEDEESRKWLAAIVVRCSILLGFEHSSSILETSKRIIALQQLLTPHRTGDETSRPPTKLAMSNTKGKTPVPTPA